MGGTRRDLAGFARRAATLLTSDSESDMKAIFNATLVILVCALSPSISAQWPAYPTWPVPKTAGGEPNLAAPAPRTADGKPDFSGVWRGAPAGQRGAPPPATPPTGPPLATFRDVGSAFKDGLPLTPYGAE